MVVIYNFLTLNFYPVWVSIYHSQLVFNFHVNLIKIKLFTKWIYLEISRFLAIDMLGEILPLMLYYNLKPYLGRRDGRNLFKVDSFFKWVEKLLPDVILNIVEKIDMLLICFNAFYSMGDGSILIPLIFFFSMYKSKNLFTLFLYKF